jgi:hypothetical protein
MLLLLLHNHIDEALGQFVRHLCHVNKCPTTASLIASRSVFIVLGLSDQSRLLRFGLTLIF